MPALRRFLTVEITDFNHMEYRNDVLCTERIGGGSFAAVFAHPTDPNRVIKVTYGMDHAYKNYIKNLLRMRKHNPYFPMIYSAKIMFCIKHYNALIAEDYQPRNARSRSTYLVVEMERLESDPKRVITDNFYQRIRQQIGYIRMDLRHGEERNKQLVIAMLNRLRKDRYWDLHADNFLFRQDQLVLTDPVC